MKTMIQKDNELLHTIPYQRFTNVIKEYFSVLKSKLQKQNMKTNKKNSKNNL